VCTGRGSCSALQRRSQLLWLGKEVEAFEGVCDFSFFLFWLSGVIALLCCCIIAYYWSWVWVWVCACVCGRLLGCLAGVLFRVPNRTESSLSRPRPRPPFPAPNFWEEEGFCSRPVFLFLFDVAWLNAGGQQHNHARKDCLYLLLSCYLGMHHLLLLLTNFRTWHYGHCGRYTRYCTVHWSVRPSPT